MTALEIKLTKPGWKHPEWSVGGRLYSPKIRTIPELKSHHSPVYSKALEAQMGNDKGNQGLSFVFSMEDRKSPLSQSDWDEAVSCQRGSKELIVIISLIFSNSSSFSCLSSPPTFTDRTLLVEFTTQVPSCPHAGVWPHRLFSAWNARVFLQAPLHFDRVLNYLWSAC